MTGMNIFTHTKISTMLIVTFMTPITSMNIVRIRLIVNHTATHTCIRSLFIVTHTNQTLIIGIVMRSDAWNNAGFGFEFERLV